MRSRRACHAHTSRARHEYESSTLRCPKVRGRDFWVCLSVAATFAMVWGSLPPTPVRRRGWPFWRRNLRAAWSRDTETSERSNQKKRPPCRGLSCRSEDPVFTSWRPSRRLSHRRQCCAPPFALSILPSVWSLGAGSDDVRQRLLCQRSRMPMSIVAHLALLWRVDAEQTDELRAKFYGIAIDDWKRDLAAGRTRVSSSVCALAGEIPMMASRTRIHISGPFPNPSTMQACAACARPAPRRGWLLPRP
jgi:hypothetical protein